MPESVSEHDCMCPSGSDQQQQQQPSNRLNCLLVAGPCKDAQLNLHTNFSPGSLWFYFPPDNWDLILFIALWCMGAQQLSAWNSYEFILGPQMHYSWFELSCWHLRQHIYFPQLSITPSPHSSISALCCCSQLAEYRASGRAGAGCCDGGSSDAHTHTCMGTLRGDGLAVVPHSVKWQTRIVCWRAENTTCWFYFAVCVESEQVFRNLSSLPCANVLLVPKEQFWSGKILFTANLLTMRGVFSANWCFDVCRFGTVLKI